MIRRGELWRLISAIFPHANFLHLAFNIYWLWVFGTLVEQVYGHITTAALILLFALGSSGLEFAFSVGGVGLSGVGYGLFGLLAVLSSHDERFRDAVDQRTIELFVLWFFFCILMTFMRVFLVANVAHGAGLILGLLTGTAITLPQRRLLSCTGVGALLMFGLWGSTLGRPRINLSGRAGYEEAEWGYDALVANRDRDAVRWLGDAVKYQPNSAICWFDLGIAYERLGNKAAAQAAYEQAQQLEPKNSQKPSRSLIDSPMDSISSRRGFTQPPALLPLLGHKTRMEP